MFAATRPFALFEYFRVPYTCVGGQASGDVPISGVASLWAVKDGPALFWSTSSLDRPPNAYAGAYVLSGIPLFGTVVPDSVLRHRLAQLGGTWVPETPVRSDGNTHVASIWRRADGSVLLPFDPSEIITNYLSESYKLLGRGSRARLEAVARHSYYRIRPFLPRSSQMRLRRRFSRVQARSGFPRWPIETALHDFYRLIFSFVAEIASEPVPTLAPWPRNFRWALVLTHDVEGPIGHANLLRLLEVELRRGYRSSWNFVPGNAHLIDDVFVDELRASGFEIGIHGLLHDGRDLSSLRTLRKRLPQMRRYAERWQAVGFRSPSTLRSWELMPLLGFEYDTSYTDTAPFEPQPGGCCSWLPYMINDLVELPITLPQDHTLYELLGHRDGALWLEKSRFLRDQGGMALILTHPDYIGNPRLLASYVDLLDEFREDETVWRALPREVSAWWRHRAATTLRQVDGRWEIAGRASADDRIEFVTREKVPL